MSVRPVTVLGASGFVGSHLIAHLKQRGEPVRGYLRSEWPRPGDDLGDVIYTVGLTADFRSRPFDTVEAHVDRLAEILEHHRFASLLYLSSTRVYRGAADTDEETALVMSPTSADRLYDLSKLLGECLCLSRDNPAIRVARLSNLYGPGQTSPTFLPLILKEALATGRLAIGQALDSSKDYVNVRAACGVMVAIARGGRQRLYNVASGVNTKHGEITDWIERELGVKVEVRPGAAVDSQPAIRVKRLREEFDWSHGPLAGDLGELVSDLKASGG